MERRVNLFQLIWLALFVGGGAYIGKGITSGWVGPIVGAMAGYVALIAIGNLQARELGKSPQCRCGVQEWGHFKVLTDDHWHFVHLAECGRRYLMRKGYLWFEVHENNTPVLTQIRDFWGNWREPTEREIASKRFGRMVKADRAQGA
jgi:hypothetical protein